MTGPVGAIRFLMEEGKAREAVLLQFDIFKFHFGYIFSGELYLYFHDQRFQPINLHSDLCFLFISNGTATKLFSNSENGAFMPVVQWYAMNPNIKGDF